MQSHAHLVLTFLCAIGLMAAMEAAMSFTTWHDRLTDTLALVACIGIGVWALRRYLYLLNHAEFVASQAECKQCGTYGRLDLVAEPLAGGPTSVRCRQCGQHWGIDS